MNPKQNKENVSRRCQQSLEEQNHSQLRNIYLDWQVSPSVLRPNFFLIERKFTEHKINHLIISPPILLS